MVSAITAYYRLLCIVNKKPQDKSLSLLNKKVASQNTFRTISEAIYPITKVSGVVFETKCWLPVELCKNYKSYLEILNVSTVTRHIEWVYEIIEDHSSLLLPCTNNTIAEKLSLRPFYIRSEWKYPSTCTPVDITICMKQWKFIFFKF